MTTPGKTLPQRNDPCPCGSGKKYKHCCGAKPAAAAGPAAPVVRKSGRDTWLIALGMLVLVAATIFALVKVDRNRPAAARPAGAAFPLNAAGTSGPTPKAWEYDAANNRHWDPTHGHWHDGPPPPMATPQ